MNNDKYHRFNSHKAGEMLLKQDCLYHEKFQKRKAEVHLF